MTTAHQPEAAKHSMWERLTPEQRSLLTADEADIIRFTDWYAARMDLEAPSFSSMRIGLQMLEVAIVRMEAGLPIDDFVTGDSPPAQFLTKVWELYRAYRACTTPVEEVIAALRYFNEEYVTTVVHMFGFPEDMLRSTGVAEARKKFLQERGKRRMQ